MSFIEYIIITLIEMWYINANCVIRDVDEYGINIYRKVINIDSRKISSLYIDLPVAIYKIGSSGTMTGNKIGNIFTAVQ